MKTYINKPYVHKRKVEGQNSIKLQKIETKKKNFHILTIKSLSLLKKNYSLLTKKMYTNI